MQRGTGIRVSPTLGLFKTFSTSILFTICFGVLFLFPVQSKKCAKRDILQIICTNWVDMLSPTFDPVKSARWQSSSAVFLSFFLLFVFLPNYPASVRRNTRRFGHSLICRSTFFTDDCFNLCKPKWSTEKLKIIAIWKDICEHRIWPVHHIPTKIFEMVTF